MAELKKVLIEEWLPAQAIGVECMRERGSSSALAPTTYLHVWWARRPLTASRAAVLGSLLPADFDKRIFERLLGFGIPGEELVERKARMVLNPTERIGFNSKRAFTNELSPNDVEVMREAIEAVWGENPTVLDPMAGGGSIPLESHRMGFNVLANELNPVACSILEAELLHVVKFGQELVDKSRKWGKVWIERSVKRLEKYFAQDPLGKPLDGFLFAQQVPCPDTGHMTPLVPDWYLTKIGDGGVVAMPVVDKNSGTWTIEVKTVGPDVEQEREAPKPTYSRGKGVYSLFSGQPFDADYIKAMAQQGKMVPKLYAVGTKATKLEFRAVVQSDLDAITAAEEELARVRPKWERDNVIPTEEIPEGDKTHEQLIRGVTRWADMFSDRQLLGFGVLVEELRQLQPEITQAEGQELADAIEHLLAFVIDKATNRNSTLASWDTGQRKVRSVFDRHDLAFKPTFAEMAFCVAGKGIEWSFENTLDAVRKLVALPSAGHDDGIAPTIISGTARSLSAIPSGTITAVVVDPPYADNVQYSEIADFFYVWLKRTQGHRHPDWFSTPLSDHSDEAVVNISRHRYGLTAAQARAEAHKFYQQLMIDSFREMNRVLRDDGVLTVMFTHKSRDAWANLFDALITAGFSIHASWPIKTESPSSLHQAKKNAAQSTVLLTCRKRSAGANVGYFHEIRDEVRQAARSTAAGLKAQGLNPVDQLVGAFGPAMKVFTRYASVRTEAGQMFATEDALQFVADQVEEWRLDQLFGSLHMVPSGLDEKSRFVLLCWDVMQAAEFRFDDARLLGLSSNDDVKEFETLGLLTTKSSSIRLLSAQERRRDKAIQNVEEVQAALFEGGKPKRGSRKHSHKIHPSDNKFLTAIDACHALALRYVEAGGGTGGIGSAKSLVLQQRWEADSEVAALMDALVKAAPKALRFPKLNKKGQEVAGHMATIYPEFRAWHALLEPLFGIESQEWKVEIDKIKRDPQLFDRSDDEEELGD